MNLLWKSLVGGRRVALILTAVCVSVTFGLIALQVKRTKDRRQLEEHSVTPETLHTLMVSKQPVLLFDVRQPLDLLAYSEISPGATRIPPKEVIENPLLIPREKDSIVYCTCPSDKTSREILQRALALNFLRIKFLKGGLEGWKALGYPVEPYTDSFRL
jgi:rhodanese-related sulfurtransferase